MVRVCILSFSPVATDPRVLHQIEALRGTADLTIVGFGDYVAADARFERVSAEPSGLITRRLPAVLRKALSGILLLLNLNDWFYWSRPHVRQAHRAVMAEGFDVIIANNFETVPLARRIGRGIVPIFLDAQEFTPDEFSRGWVTKMFKRYKVEYLIKRQVSVISKAFTVSQSIADAYQKDFGIQGIELVLNTPKYQQLSPSDLQGSRIRLIHHGIASRGRQIEKMIEAMREIGHNFVLTLMLMPSEPSYLQELKAMSEGLPIEFIEPVPTREIARRINDFDVGVFQYHADTFNAEYCLPNKFFEFIQGRLAVVVGPSPEMAKIVREFDLGVVAEDFSVESLVAALKRLCPEDIARYKRNSDLAARKFSWESDSPRLLAAVNALIGVSKGPSS